MAEVAAAIAVEEVISTTVQASVVGGYALSQSTLPLKATFSRLATVPTGDPTPDSLARSHHSVTVIDNAVYIFGGLTSATTFAGNEMHILQLNNIDTASAQYRVIPALPTDPSNTTTSDIPSPRAGHTATVLNGKIAIFGGFGPANSSDTSASQTASAGEEALDEAGRIYLFDPATLRWTAIETVSPTFPLRYDHCAAAWADKWGDKKLLVHGGGPSPASPSSQPWTDTWCFDFATREWTTLPAVASASVTGAMAASSPASIAIVDNMLYLISGGESQFASHVYMLDLAKGSLFGGKDDAEFAWTTVQFPTNPLTPGPRPRKGAALLPLKTGMGRTYLLYMLGAKVNTEDSDAAEIQDKEDKQEHQDYWSGIWALQLPSKANTPASVKDATRESLGVPTYSIEWAEVGIVPVDDASASQQGGGKVHPGPRGYFAADVVDGTTKIVLWGGLDAKGDTAGDGWLVEFKGPSPPGPLDLIRGKREG